MRFTQNLLGILMAAAVLAPIGAQASIRDTVDNIWDQFTQIANPRAVTPPESGIRRPPAQVRAPELGAYVPVHPEYNIPALPALAAVELPDPSVETPFKKIFCAEYARIRSGMAIFGDAKFWWARAKSLYVRATAPAENAVMVFKMTSRLKLGHVAVVTNVISKREIRVDQANWQNHGEIDHATPVLDVSKKNDWSQVRVWDLKSGQYGRVYPVSGFIFDPQKLIRQASND